MFKQRKQYIHFFVSFCFVLLFGILFLSFADQVSAQSDTFGVGTIDQNVALGNQSLTQTVVKIINIALGLLGIIAVCIVLYGGFIYMTSGGNEEKVGQAKKILVNGTIGLAIILSAWTITYFVLDKLGHATGALGGEEVSSRCRDAQFAQENPEICFPEADFDGGDELDCALRHRSVLLVRGITPTGGDAKAPTGMNNAKIRVLFNNPVNQVDATQIFDIYKIENGQEVTTTASFVMQFVDSDPALVDAIYRASDGSDHLPQGEYVVKVNKSLKTLALPQRPLVEAVSCGNYPANAKFVVDTDGVVDIQPPQIGPIQLNGRPANPQGDEYPRGKIYNYAFTALDNSGIGLVQFHITIRRNGEVFQTLDAYDIPKVAIGSKSTNENPFIAHLPLSVSANANLFDEYTIDVTVFDIDGNTSVTQIQGIVVGANCQPGDQSEECLNQNRRCTSDLQCPSRKCLDNQCVEWPVITDVNPRSGIWDGAPGNYITIVGNYFGEEAGRVEFGYEKDGRNDWVLANPPVCGGQNLWHNDSIVVMVPEYGAEDEEHRAVIRVTKVRGAAENVDFVDTTTDNHGPIPGPNQGRFIKNAIKRPGLCSVVVAAGNANIVAGATKAPINTALLATGNAFGNVIGTGKIEFGVTQGEVTGWSNDSIATRVPSNIQPGITYVGVVQNNFQSNDVPFTVVSAVAANRPEIISIDPATTTPKSFITVFGKNFGENVGEVFLAPAADTNCRPAGVLNRNCLLLNLQSCGDGAWSDTQIIGQIPGDTPVKNYFVIVERNGDLVVSQGESSVGVENDPPLPGICFFAPNSGPAPLADDQFGLKFKGINFSLTPKLYFSNNKSNPQNYGTWLVAQGNDIHKVVAESNAVITTITSTIPVNAADGTTLTANSESVIRLQNAEGAFSNAVKYSVNDCQNSPAIPGFQCCSEGSEKGFFKPEAFLCAGETREAGYVWRFTTGKIPEIPQVIERCDKNQDPAADQIIPSPSPWKNWLAPNELACVNQLVQLSFSLPENSQLEGATDPNKVKMFTCEDNEGVPDCTGNNKSPVVLDKTLGDLVLDADGANLVILDNPMIGASRLLPETWYHVEISKDIESVRDVSVAGSVVRERQKLLINRSCSDETAYCFDFKTGTLENRCDLVRAGVLPNPFTVDYLGVLQVPGLRDMAHVLNPPENSILYYKVWGAGSQDCSVVNVQGLGWEWRPTEGDRSEDADNAVTERKINNDTRAKVTSIQNTVPESVPIRASANNNNAELITGQAHLTIDLGAPTIVDFWPSCTESCIEAEMGVRFSRQMMKDTLVPGNVYLMKCNDELCEDGNGVQIVVDTSVNDYYSFRFVPAGNELLEKGVWYKVTLLDGIRGLGRLGLDPRTGNLNEANDQPGKAIEPFSWRFRTTDKPDGKCIADKVVIEPRNFIARNIGERTQYNSQPRTAPNKCSKLGQNLNPWMYGWDWKTVLPQTSDLFPGGHEVASVSNYEVQGKIKSFCGITCIPYGSNISTDYNGNYPLCGNGIVEPGEDCDIGMASEAQTIGVSCSFNCLRPGNSNHGVDVAAKQCGDGVVSTEVGEECDPRDLAHGGAFCNTTCLWMGGVSEVQSTTGTPWCGSGNVVFGKDCDIHNDATTTPSGKLGCSAQCLHFGTSLSSSWCLAHKDQVVEDGRTIGELPECKASLTVCGNGRLEPGEECEYFHEGDQTGIYAALAEGAAPARAVTSSLFVCNNRCLLGNVCTLNSIPLHPDGPRCQKGTPGCSDECHIVGSSVAYPNASFCGDSIVGTGEHLMCENTDVAEADKLGQTPVQMVTAIGNGDLNPETKTQNADVLAGITKKRNENKEIIDSPEKPIGREGYALQCGFTETVDVPQGNLLANRDSNMESADTSAWEFGEGLQIGKTTEVKLSGLRSLHVQGFGYLAVQNIGVQKGKTYRLSLSYRVGPSVDQREPQQQGIWPYPFTLQRDMPDVEGMANEGPYLTWNGPKVEMTDWIHFQRDFTVPENYDGVKPYGIGIRLGQVNMYLDDIVVEEVPPLVLESKNDCPNNADNGNGVSTNSCCYPRPNKSTTYPVHLTEDVCQNTLINVVFAGSIDKTSLENNIMLVSLHGPNTQCGVGEQDVTQDMAVIRGNGAVAFAEPVGFFHRLWNGVKQFFAGIFGLEDAIAVVGEKWCGSKTSFTPSVRYVPTDDMRGTISIVSLALKNSLLKETKYSVVLLGGNNGIKNSRGVGLKSSGIVNGKYRLFDSFEFTTGSKICKIESVNVDPGKYIFVKPNTTSTFVANIVSNNKSQKIQPILGVYSWDMSWMPSKSPLFQIPTEGTASTTETIEIRSTNLEGNLSAAAIVHVDMDISNEDNQTGRAFSAPFELTSNFCENLWPPREYFPYEDGVSFGSYRNNDNTVDGIFDGKELPAVTVNNLADSGVGAEIEYADAYFNTSFSYCADANLAGNTDDDLPYLKPLVFSDSVIGKCEHADGSPLLPERPVVSRPAAVRPRGGVGPLVGRPLGIQPADVALPDAPAPAPVALECSFSFQCQQNDKQARCVSQEHERHDSTLTEGVWKKFLFVNDKNDDAIGLQIMQNSKDLKTREPVRRTAREWYQSQFPGENFGSLRDMTIAGYDAVFDGKSYYVNALNQNDGPTSNIYNNIYIFSINNNAQADTKKVFEQIMTSLKFNINVSEMGYCLAENPVGAVEAAPAVPGRCEFNNASCVANQDCGFTGEIRIAPNGGVNHRYVIHKPGYCALNIMGRGAYAIIENVTSQNGDPNIPPELLDCSTVNDCNDWFDISQPEKIERARQISVFVRGISAANQRYSAPNSTLYDFVNPRNNTVFSAPGTQVICQNPQNNIHEFGPLLAMGLIPLREVQHCRGVQPATEFIPGNLNQHQTLRDNFDRLSTITDQSCQTDFDCRDVDGLVLSGTNGVCSNAKTKLLRDWKRLTDVKIAQSKLEGYKRNEQHPNYPLLESGTFIPGYTNSMWGSWNLFGSSIGGSLVDPINKWSKCGDYDGQTCWDAVSSTVHCPFVSSITEYQVVTSTGYQLHIPFEYFSLATPLNPVVSEILGNDNISKLTTEPWCRSNAAIQAIQGVCGNGVVNTGEQCDPVGFAERVNEGYIFVNARQGGCEFQNNQQCLLNADCNFTGQIQVHGQNERFFSSKSGYCVVDGNRVGIVEDRSIDHTLIGCERQQDCGHFDYQNAPEIRIRNIQIGDTIFEGTGLELLNQFRNIFGAEAEIKCFNPSFPNPGPGQVENLTRYRNLGFTSVDQTQQCIGGQEGVNGIFGQCPAGNMAQRICNDSCQWEYGSCKGGAVCGNGKLEVGEICDSGALNGTYGRCAGRQSIQGHPEMECKAYHPQYCGNGSVDERGNEESIEACEYVKENVIVALQEIDDDTNKFTRFVLSGIGKIPADCGRSSACQAIKFDVNSFLVNHNRRCSEDKSILCFDDDGCFAPSVNFSVNLANVQNPQDAISRMDQNWFTYDLGARGGANRLGLQDYGPCVDAPHLGSDYAYSKDLSCNNSCTAAESYCGDGIIQQSFEQCDDSNAVDGDGCNRFCQNEVGVAASGNQQSPALACGNGKVDNGETCDMGVDNGRECVPSEYGKACSYCSADCRNILTVDSLAYCGDNLLDTRNEKCDLVKPAGFDTSIIYATVPGHPEEFPLQPHCIDNEKGSYSCSNQCQSLENTCVMCGVTTQVPGGGTPLYLSIINPMVSTNEKANVWAADIETRLYAKRDIKAGANSNTDKVYFDEINDRPGFDLSINHAFKTSYFVDRISGRDNANAAPYFNQNGEIRKFLSEGDGIVSKDLCKQEYGFIANGSNLQTSLYNGADTDIGHMLNSDDTDFFPLDFSGVGQHLNNEFIWSPAVRQNNIRVVLRWEKKTNPEEQNYDFVGVIENRGFRDGAYINEINASMCDEMVFGQDGYWIPAANCQINKGSVYVHGNAATKKITTYKGFLRSMTIDMNCADCDGGRKFTYAYVVKALGARQGVVPMGSLVDDEKVFVDVYVFHPGQDPRYSIYQPAYSFGLGDVRNGSSINSSAQFWHVFNLYFDDHALGGPQYVIQPPKNQLGESYPSGKLATCQEDVWCYVDEPAGIGRRCLPEGCNPQ